MNPWNQITDLPNVDVLIDVGVGEGTQFLYDAFPDASLILVDPIEQVQTDREYTFFKCAASNTSGTVLLNVDANSINMHSTYTRSPLTRSTIDYSIEVECNTLDNLIIDKSKTFGLKVDAEGADLDVLQGSIELLKHCKWVICEVSVLERFENSYKFEDVINFMKQQKFTVNCILSAFPDNQGRIRYLNIGFVRA
jgi:FkbM family methyltransferase